MIKIIQLLIIFLFAQQSFSQWTLLNSGSGSNFKSIYFTSASTGYVCGSGGVIIKTTNGGVNWSSLSSGLGVDINSIYFYNASTGLACANSGNIIITTNSGNSWNTVPSGVSANLFAISFFNNVNGVCTGTNGTLLFSTNGGLNWTVAVDGFITTYYSIHMVSASVAYAGGVNTIFQPLIAKTTNGGANWNYSVFYLNNNEGNIRGIHFLNASSGFAVSNVWNGQGAISFTSNGGTNWTTQLFANALNGIDFSGGNTGYAVGYSGSVLKTTDGGVSWSPQTSGTSAVLRSVNFIDSLTGYAASDGGVIIKTTNGGVTAFNNQNGNIPAEYRLNQNYPNPFNPVTRIGFELPVGATRRVALTVFDALGREIETLVNRRLSPGTYEVDWDASNYPSGVYMYKLDVIDPSAPLRVRETKKMILIK
ncbi:MAG: YCF48-related protein [Chlorobi bacterium]|nr:YCF48-related protein [Chlorobiota bacterium]